MDLADISFNMNYFLADDLREAPEDVEQMRSGVKLLKDAALLEEQELIRAKIYSHIGFYSRLITDLHESHDFYEQSIALFDKHKKKLSSFGTKIQLAITYHWMGKFAKADSFFNQALEICNETSEPKIMEFKALILESYAKSKYDQHSITMAEEFLSEALELRVVSGDIRAINDVTKALSVVTNRLAKS
ncbi:hypothetical protein BIY24_11820 [Halobacteriovorax marinus]|uniref:tetratricopeptide repeat protein n=1 Tax=Halobacteriovorax marinus TaxID=97084 RepID=UPI000BC31C1D|nr:tetratricopeptide repeat protein [Halobacteriovorax marinus]ATH08607.1 hypothetical protein BIY24_11820 [Halobacteriovorax marinus]